MQDDIAFVVQRARQDRRNGELLEPPYMTDEGMVLFDRRSHEDRRGVSMPLARQSGGTGRHE